MVLATYYFIQFLTVAVATLMVFDTMAVESAKPCSSNPCRNGATCHNDLALRSFVCICTNHYTGPTCESTIITNPCSSNPCLNGGHCQNTLGRGGYFCFCPEGTSGRNCQITAPGRIVVPCSSGPCQNGATCYNDLAKQSYFCLCTSSFTGQNCNQNYFAPCFSNPCENGGTCVDQWDTNTYTCKCPDIFAGTNCDQAVLVRGRSQKDCLKICSRVSDPVCASDGKTYGSMCVLEVFICQNPELKLKWRGPCAKGPPVTI